MNRKEHLTSAGLQEIVNIRASINHGLSDSLLAAFPDTIPVPRPLIRDQNIQDPNWVAGFTAGEGNFLINTIQSSRQKTGAQVQLRFLITQHSRDAQLIKSLVSYLGCGRYKLRSRSKSSEVNAGDYIVTVFVDHIEKIIPFFENYPIVGAKALDYADFKKAAEIMKVGGHLTKDGLDQIRLIKASMNAGRNS